MLTLTRFDNHDWDIGCHRALERLIEGLIVRREDHDAGRLPRDQFLGIVGREEEAATLRIPEVLLQISV